jgi:stress-induced morphogen
MNAAAVVPRVARLVTVRPSSTHLVRAMAAVAGEPAAAGGAASPAAAAAASAAAAVGSVVLRGADGPIAASLVARLTAAFAPVTHLELENESHRHSVPPGSESHFKVFIVSPAFEGLPILERHRRVNAAAGSPLPVHALSIAAKTPAQWAAGAVAQSTPGCLGGSKHDAAPPAGAKV